MRSALLSVVVAGCGRVAFDPIGAIDDAPSSTTDGAVEIACGARTAGGVAEDGRISGDFSTFTDDAVGTCGGGTNNDQVYAIDVVEGGGIVVGADQAGTTATTIVYARSTCDEPATELFCDTGGGRGANAAFRTGALAAGRYWIFVDRDNGAGTYNGTLQSLRPVGSMCTPNVPRDRCAPNLDCVNDVCALPACDTSAPISTFPIDVMVTTPGKPNLRAGTCGESFDGGSRAPEAQLVLSLAAGVQNLNITTNLSETDFDTLLYIRQGTCEGIEVGCNDDDDVAGSLKATLDTGPLAAGDYFLYVDGFGADAGTARVVITATP